MRIPEKNKEDSQEHDVMDCTLARSIVKNALIKIKQHNFWSISAS